MLQTAEKAGIPTIANRSSYFLSFGSSRSSPSRGEPLTACLSVSGPCTIWSAKAIAHPLFLSVRCWQFGHSYGTTSAVEDPTLDLSVGSYRGPSLASFFLISGLSYKTTFNSELRISSLPLYSI